MKSTGESDNKVIPVETNVIVVGGDINPGTTAVHISNSSDSEDDGEGSINTYKNSSHHRPPKHAAYEDVQELSRGQGNSSGMIATSSVVVTSSLKIHSDKLKSKNAATDRVEDADYEDAEGSALMAVEVESTTKRKMHHGQGEEVTPTMNCADNSLVTTTTINATNYHSVLPNQPRCNKSKSLPSNKKKRIPAGGTISQLGDSSNEITTIRELTSEQSNSVSGVLRFCKRRVLFPYLKLLGAMGLKPLYSDGTEQRPVIVVMNKIYLIMVGLVLVMGYVLQFMTCFRRDQGFAYKKDFLDPPTSLFDYPSGGQSNSSTFHAVLRKTSSIAKMDSNVKGLLDNTICTGNVIYVYFIPSVLHVSTFIYMVYIYWIYDDEHLQNLMERVFIQAAHANINFFSQRRLVRRLQALVCIGCIWITVLSGCQIARMYFHKIYINIWIELEYNMTYALATFLTFATLWQDAVQVTIVISFAIQCSLICTYTELIKGRLMQHSISLVECMKELGELGQLLSYLNDDLGLGLAPLLIIDGIYATGAIVHLIRNGKNLPLQFLILLVLSACLWIFIIAFPLAQAARVSTCCQQLKDMGHMIRIRPFGYQFVPQTDLDSFLLFVSNLNLKARILKVPITSSILSVTSIALSVGIFLWLYFQ